MLLSNFALVLAFLIDFWYWNVSLFRKRNEKIPYICIIMLLINYALIEYTKWLENNNSFGYASLTIKEYFINLPLDWQNFIEMIENLHYVNMPNLIFFNAIVFIYWSQSLVLICILAILNNYYFLTIEYASYNCFYYFLFLLTIFVYIYFNHKAWRQYSDLWMLIKYIRTLLLIFDFVGFISQLCGYNLKIADLALWLFLKISELIAQVLILWFYSTIIKYATLILDGYLSNYNVRFHRTSWFKDNLLGTAGMYVVIALSIVTMFLTQIEVGEFIENPVYLKEGLYFLGSAHIGLILHYPNSVAEDKFIVLNTCGVYLPILIVRNVWNCFV